MLLLVRHGQTEANARGLLLGRADPPLSELGRRQAAALATRVPGDARLIASPLLRTMETARAFGRPVEADERWIELDYGSFDGRSVAEVPADVWKAWRTDPHYVPGGGESLATLGLRVREACEELLEEARSRDVIIVSHVSPIKAAVSWVLGAGAEAAWRSHLDQASLSRVTVSARGPVLRSFNETWHLTR